MSDSSRALSGGNEHAQERLRQLVHDMGEQMGKKRGWKKAVAERLEITPSMLSRLLSGTQAVGGETMYRIANELGFEPAYFEEEGGTYRDYQPTGARGRELASETVDRHMRWAPPEMGDLADRIENAVMMGEEPSAEDIKVLAAFVVRLPGPRFALEFVSGIEPTDSDAAGAKALGLARWVKMVLLK